MVHFEVIDLREKYQKDDDGANIEYDLITPGRTKIFDYSDIIEIMDLFGLRDKPPTHQVSVTVPCYGKDEHSFFCFGYIQYIFHLNLRGAHDIYPQSLSDELYFFDNLKEKFAEYGNNNFERIQDAFTKHYSHLPDLTSSKYKFFRKMGKIDNYEPGITVDKNYVSDYFEDKLEQIEFNILANACFGHEVEKYKPIFCVRGQYLSGSTIEGNTPECTYINFFLYSFKDLSKCKFGLYIDEILKMRLSNLQAATLMFTSTLQARRPNVGGKMDPGLFYTNNFQYKLI